MISVPSFSVKGTAGEKVKLPEGIFGVKGSPAVIAQAVRVYLSNQREASAKTKTRAEVKKTTAKMYRQKGTGRARHGSYAAPIFVGGGIAHGPDGRQNFKRRMSATQARLALFTSLSIKAKTGLVVLNGLKTLNKTAEANKLIGKISENSDIVLVIVAKGQEMAYRALRNLSRVTTVYVNQLNTYSIVKHPRIAVSSEALEELTKLFLKK